MKTNRKITALRAFTLAECLVVMIVGGIVFLGIAEGLGMLSGYVAKRSQALTAEQQSYSDITVLGQTFAACDSIANRGGELTVYSRGDKSVFRSKEGKLIMEAGGSADTLFPGYSAFLNINDSLCAGGLPYVRLSVNPEADDGFVHTFSPSLSPATALKKSIEEYEEEYLYE